MAKQTASAQVATKSDIKRLEQSTKSEIERLENKIDGVDQKLDEKFDKVMTMLDGIAKGVDDLRTENTVGAHQERELRVQVDDHEKRIENLESAV